MPPYLIFMTCPSEVISCCSMRIPHTHSMYVISSTPIILRCRDVAKFVKQYERRKELTKLDCYYLLKLSDRNWNISSVCILKWKSETLQKSIFWRQFPNDAYPLRDGPHGNQDETQCNHPQRTQRSRRTWVIHFFVISYLISNSTDNNHIPRAHCVGGRKGLSDTWLLHRHDDAFCSLGPS